MPKPVFFYNPSADTETQRKIVHSLGLLEVEDCSHHRLFMHLADNMLTLSYNDLPSQAELSIAVDFSHSRRDLKAKKQGQELLLRAIKTRGGQPLTILDATGGLGRDAFLIAQAGYNVTVLERDDIVSALLADGMKRGLQNTDTRETCQRMTLHHTEAVKYMLELHQQFEVIYLDPMFPDRGKTGKAKQELQVLQHLLPDHDDPCTLLPAAWNTLPKKIVVKRPVKGPQLCDLAPEYSLRGKTIRYDVYLPGSTKNPF
ncbi:class I SAM-dependent methyltransferase [Desulfogranum japonicum]|uniref:class I SAM-dependent methyltransferase n=1 Tax=Desulfogranum japonicum TaxID=231447 RepID=UPI0004111CBC|nr:class I SAM-dependent methyltransferase [Desulfogranum japonicum]